MSIKIPFKIPVPFGTQQSLPLEVYRSDILAQVCKDTPTEILIGLALLAPGLTPHRRLPCPPQVTTPTPCSVLRAPLLRPGCP